MKSISFMLPNGALTVEVVRDALGLICTHADYLVPRIESWTNLERIIAYDYAMRVHLRVRDLRVRRREFPTFLKEAFDAAARASEEDR